MIIVIIDPRVKEAKKRPNTNDKQGDVNSFDTILSIKLSIFNTLFAL